MAAPDPRLADRYQRIAAQLGDLFTKNRDPIARMATIVAVLHHKMPHYFWTGFYRLIDGELVVLDPEGRSDFNRLQKRARLRRRHDVEKATVELPATLFAFDFLGFEGFDLRPLPLLSP